MKTSQLGLLTIGQSPRDDVVPVLRQFLRPEIPIHQVGALDALDDAEIAKLQPLDALDGIETRLRTGAPVVVSKHGLDGLLADALAQFSPGIPILLLCSSSFPSLAGRPGVIQPDELILPVVRHAARGHLLGVIGPASDLPRQPDAWHPHVPGAIFAAGSPHDSPEHLNQAGETLVSAGATMIFLDCMGFGEEQRTTLGAHLNQPVLCATTLVGRILPEFL